MKKSLLIAALATTAVLAGCDKKETPPTPKPPTTAMAPTEGAANAGEGRVTYTCEGGKILTLNYLPENKATLNYDGKNYSLAAASAYSKRYTGDGFEWNRADPGAQSQLSKMTAGTKGETLASCTEPAHG